MNTFDIVRGSLLMATIGVGLVLMVAARAPAYRFALAITVMALVLFLIPAEEGSAAAPPDGLPSVDKQRHELITGFYECVGTQPSGEAYSSLVTIARAESVYVVRWINDGGVVTGVGFREGHRLVVGWALNNPERTRGVTSYQINKGALVGTWTLLPGDGKLYSESLTLIKARDMRGPRPRPAAGREAKLMNKTKQFAEGASCSPPGSDLFELFGALDQSASLKDEGANTAITPGLRAVSEIARMANVLVAHCTHITPDHALNIAYQAWARCDNGALAVPSHPRATMSSLLNKSLTRPRDPVDHHGLPAAPAGRGLPSERSPEKLTERSPEKQLTERITEAINAGPSENFVGETVLMNELNGLVSELPREHLEYLANLVKYRLLTSSTPAGK